jgi:hypothetical protein
MNQSLVTSKSIDDIQTQLANVYKYIDGLLAVSSVNFGPTVPAVEKQNLPWIRNDGTSIRIYTWNGKLWVSPNQIAPQSLERRLWIGTESASWSYDGGDGTDPRNAATAPTDISGAMWRVDHDWDWKFPVGVGTNPFTNTIFALNDTGGAETHAHTIPSVGGFFGLNPIPVATLATDPATHLPPWRACFIIKRSNRVHYTITS